MRQLSVVLGITVIAAVGPALPAHAAVGCGATLASSATLTGNLNCPGSTITITGDGVVLNFAGFTLAGNGTSAGVRIEGTGVRLRGGTIRGFDSGVLVAGDDSPSVHLFAMTVRNNATGVAAANAMTRVSGSRILDNVIGLGGGEGGEGGPFRVSGTTIARNGTGIDVNSGSNGAWVAQSVIEGNGIGIACSQDIFTVTGTKVRNNGIGIAAFECDGSSIRTSHVTGNATGLDLQMILDGPGYVVADNYLLSNTTGINLHSMAAATISGNRFRYNGVGIGTSGNTDGIDAAEGTIANNEFYANGDGVFIDEPSTFSITGNRAFRNTNWGLYSSGTVASSGNIAYGNGQPAQCSGVVCAAS